MSFFKSLLRILAIIIVIIAIIILIYAAFLALTIGTATTTLIGTTIAINSWALLAVGVGLLLVASVVSPEGFNEAMDKVGKGAEVIGDTVGNAIGGVTSGVLKGLGLDGALPWIVGGIALYFVLGSSGGSNTASYGNDSFDHYPSEPKSYLRPNQDYDGGYKNDRSSRNFMENSDIRAQNGGYYA